MLLPPIYGSPLILIIPDFFEKNNTPSQKNEKIWLVPGKAAGAVRLYSLLKSIGWNRIGTLSSDRNCSFKSQRRFFFASIFGSSGAEVPQ